MTYDQLHLASRRPLTKYAGPLQDPIRSKEKVYRLEKLDEPLVVGGALERNDTCQRPAIPTEKWIVQTEPTEGDDTFAESIIQRVLAGFSCMIQGAPGTGKSHLLAEIRDRLQGVGHLVETLAPTNAAARIIGGRTIHNFCARIGKSDRGFAGTLLIDEISMVSLGLVAVLDHLRSSGCRIISFGDWDQLEPVGNSWRGKAVAPSILRESALLKRWSGSNLFELTRCRRSDQVHFDMYTRLHPDLRTAIAATRAVYKKSSRAERGALHLVISHKKRRTLNAIHQTVLADGKAGLDITGHEGEPEYRCVVGTPLCGSCTGHGFTNGAFYRVVDIAGLKVKDCLTEEVLECTPEILAKHTCLGHAVVYNRAQGMTCNQRVVLHDMGC